MKHCRYCGGGAIDLRAHEENCVMRDDGEFVCKCDCGGDVRGVSQFGRLFTWCTRCTPVVKVNIESLRA